MKRKPKRYLSLAKRQQDFIFYKRSIFKPVTREDFCPIGNVLDALDRLIHHLQNFSVYHKLGAQLPAGAIFYGPTGTGKTYTSRFLATEARATFIDIREFPRIDDEYSFSREEIRVLFRLGKELVQRTCRPCIFFWDQFDAFLEDASKDAVSQLYTELDGIAGGSNGVFLVVATSKDIDDEDEELFDEQLLRSGRLEIQIKFTHPTRLQQSVLLKHYLNKKPHIPIDGETIIYVLNDPSPVVIRHMVDEAYRRACLRELLSRHRPLRPEITEEDLLRVGVDIMLGYSLKVDISPEAMERVAIHETGHALVARALGRPVQLISLVPTAGGFGATMSIVHWSQSPFKENVESDLACWSGGFAVDQLLKIPSVYGARGDLERLTDIAKDLVTRTGEGSQLFQRFGPMAIQSETNLPLSQALLQMVEKDIGSILKKQYQRAYAVLTRIGERRIRYIAQELLKKDPPIIMQEEFDAIRKAAFRKFPRR